MKADIRLTKAYRIAKAYEEAGYLFDLTATEALGQMALWAGITVKEARAFAQMVENRKTGKRKPAEMPE